MIEISLFSGLTPPICNCMPIFPVLFLMTPAGILLFSANEREKGNDFFSDYPLSLNAPHHICHSLSRKLSSLLLLTSLKLMVGVQTAFSLTNGSDIIIQALNFLKLRNGDHLQGNGI